MASITSLRLFPIKRKTLYYKYRLLRKGLIGILPFQKNRLLKVPAPMATSSKSLGVVLLAMVWGQELSTKYFSEMLEFRTSLFSETYSKEISSLEVQPPDFSNRSGQKKLLSALLIVPFAILK